MIIGTKLANVRKQVDDRVLKGAKYAELHTTYKDFEDGINEKKYKYLTSKINLISVHSPMKNSKGNMCGTGYKLFVDEEEYLENLDLIKASIVLASKLIKADKKIVIVHILQTEQNKIDEIGIEKVEESIKKELKMLSKFAKSVDEKVCIAVENTTRKNINNSEYKYGTADKFVKLIEELKLENVGTTLDICHALGTIYVDKHKKDVRLDSIEKYIDSYAKTLKHIHLSNARGPALEKKDHGMTYIETEKDLKLLRRIFLALVKNKYEGNIIIETLEDDVNDARNYMTTIRSISKM